MNELFRELEEDMRRDRARALWDEYGKWLIGVSVAIVLGTAAGVVWKNHMLKNNIAHTDALIAAYDSAEGKPEKEALAILDPVIDEGKGSAAAAIAALRAADLALKNADVQEAAKRYRAIADNAAYEPAFRGYANAMAFHLSGTEAGNQLIDDDAPLAPVQREALGWRLVSQGKNEEAAKQFAAIKNSPDATNWARQRAQQGLSYLGVKPAAKPPTE